MTNMKFAHRKKKTKLQIVKDAKTFKKGSLGSDPIFDISGDKCSANRLKFLQTEKQTAALQIIFQTQTDPNSYYWQNDSPNCSEG